MSGFLIGLSSGCVLMKKVELITGGVVGLVSEILGRVS